MGCNRFEYSVTSPTRKRRADLKREVSKRGLSAVISNLKQRKSRSNGYRKDRLRADINFLKKSKSRSDKSFGLPIW